MKDWGKDFKAQMKSQRERGFSREGDATPNINSFSGKQASVMWLEVEK